MREAIGLLLALATACVSSGAGDGGGGGDAGGVAVDGGSPADGGTSSACLEGDPFDPAALAETVTWLAADQRRGRGPGTPEDEATRAFIAERFACLGLTPGMGDSFQQPFIAPDDVASGNVVAILPGGDLASEVILIGAHHDHLGVGGGGQIFNGANDNASGVAAMFAIAQAMKTRATPPRRTLVFAAFGYEENDGDCLGSEHYAGSPPAGLPIDDLVYMVDADMVGTYPSEGQVVAYGSLAGTPARDLLDDLVPGSGLTVALGDNAGNDDSDFQAFCDRGVPYLYFETWDLDCYHRACDDVGNLDFPSMSAVTALLADVVIGLADSDADLAAARGGAPCPL